MAAAGRSRTFVKACGVAVAGAVGLRIQQPPPHGLPNALAPYESTVFVWNPFVGAGDATRIDLPPGMTL